MTVAVVLTDKFIPVWKYNVVANSEVGLARSGRGVGVGNFARRGVNIHSEVSNFMSHLKVRVKLLDYQTNTQTYRKSNRQAVVRLILYT